jgi:ankyrin repeat protein
MACSHISSCELFVQFALNPALEIWKKAYCNGEYIACARYVTARKGQLVPLSLLPNGKKITINRSQDELATTAVEGTTALMAAVEIGSIDMVKLLLGFKPDTSKTNIHGQTAFDLALEKNDTALVKLLKRVG